MDTLTTIFYRASLCLMIAGLLSFATAQQNKNSSSMGMAKSKASSAQSTSGLSPADQKFIKEAAEGGLAEVELGQLATEKGSSDDVKKFGQRMIDDHGKANDQLKQIASSKGVDLPSEPSAKNKATKDRLSKLSGEQFDKAYMTDMLQDHKKDIAAFRRESTSGRDQDVKSFATQTLPTLQDHLKDAQSIAPKVLQAKRSTTEQPNASRR